jgi:NAD(P)H-hydrate epimerase
MEIGETPFTGRDADATKGDFGTIAFIGGSREFPNTPAICALASIKTGADVNVIFAPERAADACATVAPDLITVPLEGERLEGEHVPNLARDLNANFSAMVVGNGLGRDRTTLTAVRDLVRATDIPIVLDGDALRADVHDMELDGRKVVLTPHRGEFEHIYEEPEGQLAVLKEKVKRASRVFGATIVLKGRIDVVSDGSTVRTAESGNPYMTKGGTGDILAGACGALLARQHPLNAAHHAARITGRAGDIAVEDVGQSLMVGDILDAFPPAIDELFRED